MRIVVRLLILAGLCVAAGCSSAATGALPQRQASSVGGHPMDSVGAVPGDSVGAVPGDSVGAVPGDSVGAVPGAILSCGLPQGTQASCTIAINQNIPSLSDPLTPLSLIPGLHPADLESAYGLPSGAKGGTVAIVDAYDDATAAADLAVYRTAFGLPPCTALNGCFKKVNQSGGTSSYPVANAGWSEEISLDLDMVSAVCPQCSIVLVEANSAQMDDLASAVDTAASLGAQAISNSYYAPEWAGETAEDVHYDHPGIAITASSGDVARPNYPADSPYVTSVGGTSLTGSPGGWSQTGWQYSGQGCSVYERRPAWQHTGGICSTTRSTVDMAVVADPSTGVAMFDSQVGGWMVAGGTSVGAPVVAAAYALSGNFAGPGYSYANASDFTDVAPAGYDAVTGLGTPEGIRGL